MASNRAKLSLQRRPKKTAEQPSAMTAQTDTIPPNTEDVPSEIVGKISRNVDLPGSEIGRGDGQRQQQEKEKDDESEFRPHLGKVGRKRRIPQTETERYVDAEGQDQLQLALALSASMNPHHSTTVQDTLLPTRGKRGRHGKERANERNLPLSSPITSEESRRILAQRASAMLEMLANRSASSSVASHTSIKPSQLGQRVGGDGSSTLWDMAGYSEKDEGNKFVVPALDLPGPSQRHLSHSPQPSTHSSHTSPAHTTSHTTSHTSTQTPQSSPMSQLRPLTLLPPPVKTLLSDLSSLVGSQLCSDVIITAGDGRGIPAHSAILACRCPMLAERLFHSLDKPVHLDFSQYDRVTVVLFLRYLYTGTVPNQNGMKAVKGLALSLGMADPSGDRDEMEYTRMNVTTPLQPNTIPSQHSQSNIIPSESQHSQSNIIPSELLSQHSQSNIIPSVPSQHSQSNIIPSELLSQHSNRITSMTQAVITSQFRSSETTPTSCEATPTNDKVKTPYLISVHNSPLPSHPTSSPSSPHKVSSPLSSPNSSPLPLRERISSSLPASPVTIQSHDKSHDTSHDKSHDTSHDKSSTFNQPTSKSDPIKSTINTAVVTPAHSGLKPVLESDITPMPHYKTMPTPDLKDECSRFGVRALPKKKMVAKLTEIYDYTHPIIDDDEKASSDTGADNVQDRGQKDAPSKKPSLEELVEKVREVITKDTELYENMLLYKPLELSYIQSQLKAAAISLSKDTLMDILDQLCVTFSVPRQQNQRQKTV